MTPIARSYSVTAGFVIAWKSCRVGRVLPGLLTAERSDIEGAPDCPHHLVAAVSVVQSNKKINWQRDSTRTHESNFIATARRSIVGGRPGGTPRFEIKHCILDRGTAHVDLPEIRAPNACGFREVQYVVGILRAVAMLLLVISLLFVLPNLEWQLAGFRARIVSHQSHRRRIGANRIPADHQQTRLSGQQCLAASHPWPLTTYAGLDSIDNR